MATITVKNIPADLYEHLKASAGANHRSINGEIIACIERAVGSPKIDLEAVLAGGSQVTREVARTTDHRRRAHRGQERRTPMIVVDTNVIGYLYFPGERSEQAQESIAEGSAVGGAVALAQRVSQRLDLVRPEAAVDAGRGAGESWTESLRLMSGREHDVSLRHVLRLAAESGCSAYDCEFVALAQDLNVPLVTVDKQVLSQFPDVAIALDNSLQREVPKAKITGRP